MRANDASRQVGAADDRDMPIAPAKACKIKANADAAMAPAKIALHWMSKAVSVATGAVRVLVATMQSPCVLNAVQERTG